jgi:hypothetical protein
MKNVNSCVSIVYLPICALSWPPTDSQQSRFGAPRSNGHKGDSTAGRGGSLACLAPRERVGLRSQAHNEHSLNLRTTSELRPHAERSVINTYRASEGCCSSVLRRFGFSTSLSLARMTSRYERWMAAAIAVTVGVPLVYQVLRAPRGNFGVSERPRRHHIGEPQTLKLFLPPLARPSCIHTTETNKPNELVGTWVACTKTNKQS